MTALTRIADLNARFLDQAAQAQRNGFDPPPVHTVFRASHFITALGAHEPALEADTDVGVSRDGSVEFVISRDGRIVTVFVESDEDGYFLVVRDRDTDEVTEYDTLGAEAAVKHLAGCVA